MSSAIQPGVRGNKNRIADGALRELGSLHLDPQNEKEVLPSGFHTEQKDRDIKQESLEAAFEFFNQTSRQLTDSYKLLETRVNQLTEELDQVSAEKEAEQLKKVQLANRMQALLDFLPGGVIVLDAHGYIMQSNPAAKTLLQDPLNGKLWRKVIGECFSPRNDDGLEISTKGGKRISIATSSLDNQGQIILLTDQTETRELQQNLSRYERLSAMGKMVSALAHQIRTPLSAAILYAGHLCNDDLALEKRSLFSRKILSRLRHMERQVRDMMLFVKSELPLNDVITAQELDRDFREAIEIPLMTSKGRCQWKNHCPNSVIRCHRDALISALMNLVNNAIQASASQPMISIRFDELNKESNELSKPLEFAAGIDSTNKSASENSGHRYLRISVKDRGAGMSKELVSSAAEIFVTTKPQGTGLGLAVVQAVARAHGGSFRLVSEQGKGTLAYLDIPIVE